MDHQDAPSTPEWRPPSRLSAAFSSTPSSSGFFSPPPQTTAITAARRVSIQIAAPPTSDMEASSSSLREIAPYETFICERLLREIAFCASQNKRSSVPTTDLGSRFGQHQLSRVLQKTCTAIQFHAKWFAPDPLRTLLETALEVTSRSSSTADLYAALNLIDTICTYSILPALLPAVRFMSYAYYQGSRSNRHKRLCQHSWAVAQHILDSHLGGQFANAIFEIVSNVENVHSKYAFSAAVGALIMTRHKILPEHDNSQSHKIQPTLLLLSLRQAAIDDNDILREQATVMIGSLLKHEHIARDIQSDGGCDLVLEALQRCVGGSFDREAIDYVFKGVESRLQMFDARHQPTLAQLFVEARRPLPPVLSAQLLVPWQRALILEEDMMWTANYRAILEKLSDSTFYLKELDQFIKTSVSAFFQTEHFVSRRDFVYTLESLILDNGTAGPAVDILAKGIVRIFTYKTQKEKWEGQRNWLFPILCGIAKHSLEATRLLLRIRADEAGEGYLNTELVREPETILDRPQIPSSDLYGLHSLSMDAWVNTLHDMITDEPTRWDVYNAMLTGLASQVRNHALWRGRFHHINALRRTLCDHLNADTFVEPPADSGQSKSYVIGQLLQILTATVSYHRQLPRNEIKAAIVTIVNVAGSRDYSVSIHCIHALTICCYELPELMAGYMDAIINKMTRMVTQRNLALYVLEFFAGLSRFPDLQDRLRRDDFKRIFGVCHSYLQSIRSTTALERKRTPTSEQSAGMSSTSSDEMAQYVYALAHHVITFWYMALKREDRHGLKEYITGCLRYQDADGKEHLEDQGLVTIDLMDRVDADDQIDASLENSFDGSDGRIVIRTLVTGVLLITTETALRTGKTIVTIRRPSGTARRTIVTRGRHDSADPIDIGGRFTASVTVDEQEHINIFPDDVTGRTYGKVAIPRPASALGSLKVFEVSEENESVARAIRQFDRTPALDSHKAGIIYVGEQQTEEKEILLNESGSPDYRDFLEDMGSLRRLRGATFNSQGLDREGDADGEYTIIWNNDVTELVYHITTLMPSDAQDEHVTVVSKKRHTGNDFVNIIFNNSGGDFRFGTFPSAFNYIYIVISPSDRTSFLQAREITAAKDKKERFYNVHVLSRPGYPNLSSAAEVKVISGASLGGYVRNLTLNACVFATMWQASDEMGEYPSSWRRRLQQIRRLYESQQNRANVAPRE